MNQSIYKPQSNQPHFDQITENTKKLGMYQSVEEYYCTLCGHFAQVQDSVQCSDCRDDEQEITYCKSVISHTPSTTLFTQQNILQQHFDLLIQQKNQCVSNHNHPKGKNLTKNFKENLIKFRFRCRNYKNDGILRCQGEFGYEEIFEHQENCEKNVNNEQETIQLLQMQLLETQKALQSIQAKEQPQEINPNQDLNMYLNQNQEISQIENLKLNSLFQSDFQFKDEIIQQKLGQKRDDWEFQQLKANDKIKNSKSIYERILDKDVQSDYKQNQNEDLPQILQKFWGILLCDGYKEPSYQAYSHFKIDQKNTQKLKELFKNLDLLENSQKLEITIRLIQLQGKYVNKLSVGLSNLTNLQELSLFIVIQDIDKDTIEILKKSILSLKKLKILDLMIRFELEDDTNLGNIEQFLLDLKNLRNLQNLTFVMELPIIDQLKFKKNKSSLKRSKKWTNFNVNWATYQFEQI